MRDDCGCQKWKDPFQTELPHSVAMRSRHQSILSLALVRKPLRRVNPLLQGIGTGGIPSVGRDEYHGARTLEVNQ